MYIYTPSTPLTISTSDLYYLYPTFITRSDVYHPSYFFVFVLSIIYIKIGIGSEKYVYYTPYSDTDFTLVIINLLGWVDRLYSLFSGIFSIFFLYLFYFIFLYLFICSLYFILFYCILSFTHLSIHPLITPFIFSFVNSNLS